MSSAGLLTDGQPATDTAVDTLAERGIDIDEHRSRRISSDLLGRADLVVGMTREHVREAAVLRPDLYDRTFTLKELVRRGRQAGPRADGERRPRLAGPPRARAGRPRTTSAPPPSTTSPIRSARASASTSRPPTSSTS